MRQFVFHHHDNHSMDENDTDSDVDLLVHHDVRISSWMVIELSLTVWRVCVWCVCHVMCVMCHVCVWQEWFASRLHRMADGLAETGSDQGPDGKASDQLPTVRREGGRL